jgi:hypothetical protein
MNRGMVDLLVVLGVVLFALFLWDRADFMRMFWWVREFVSDHKEAVIVGLLALIGARLVIRSPHEIDKLRR